MFCFFRLANICSVLNGIGGSVPFAGPAALSSVWFPPEQRATATAIVSFANYLGISLSFIIGKVHLFYLYYSDVADICFNRYLKVINLCHQYTARPACISVRSYQGDQLSSCFYLEIDYNMLRYPTFRYIIVSSSIIDKHNYARAVYIQ